MIKKRVLLCDDDIDFAKLLILRLTKANFQVQLAVDGLQVMQMVRRFKPDCIVLDVNMPGGKAYETIRRLDQSVYAVAIPVILMSGEQPDFSKLNEFHQTHFLKKPFAFDRLIEEIKKLTRAETGAEEEKVV